jgi:hypothetical protein
VSTFHTLYPQSDSPTVRQSDSPTVRQGLKQEPPSFIPRFRRTKELISPVQARTINDSFSRLPDDFSYETGTSVPGGFRENETAMSLTGGKKEGESEEGRRKKLFL